MGVSCACARMLWMLLCSMLPLLLSSSRLLFEEMLLWASPESFSLADLYDWLLRRRRGWSRRREVACGARAREAAGRSKRRVVLCMRM